MQLHVKTQLYVPCLPRHGAFEQEADGDTLAHCERVKGLSMGIANIPLGILLKPGKLTDEEYHIMKEHSRYTYEMILENFDETAERIQKTST